MFLLAMITYSTFHPNNSGLNRNRNREAAFRKQIAPEKQHNLEMGRSFVTNIDHAQVKIGNDENSNAAGEDGARGPHPLCFEGATRGSSVGTLGIGGSHLAARE